MSDQDPLAALFARGQIEKIRLLKLALGAELVRDAELGAIVEALEPHGVWGLLAFLVTPDEQLRDLSPIEALRRRDPELEAMTLRLARAAADSDGFG